MYYDETDKVKRYHKYKQKYSLKIIKAQLKKISNHQKQKAQE